MNDPLLKLINHLSPDKRALLRDLLGSGPEPIAIIGAGCRFPGGATSPEAFWELLQAGRDAITEVPADRWDVDAYFDPDPGAPGKMYSRHGGFLSGVDEFDADFFGVVPPEARRMDPQHRLLLEVSWEALEGAGYRPEQLAGSQTGVFVGIVSSEYMYMQLDPSDPTCIDDAFLCTGNASSLGPGRLSYLLDLRGPSVAVDTACSSSLVAVHLACESLRRKESSMALAGGVSLILSPLSTLIASKLMAMAPDGRCKAFSASADGFVRGEGCGVVVLKRLSDALAAGDTIVALIRGSAVNQDGRSSSLTAPNGLAQQALIRQALEGAGVPPDRVGFIEAHGTGTALGDPIEVQALGAVLGQGRRQPFAIGSVKANIGHLESAAGVASLIKAALCVQRGEIPPQIHVTARNPHIPWDELPVTIPSALTPWSPEDGPRVAGVSSFGFSGTNAHVVLEQAPLPAVTSASRASQLLALSARTPAALEQATDRLAQHLESHPEQDLADVAYTSLVGRSSFAHRRTLVCRDRQDAITALSSRAPKRLLTSAAPPRELPIVFMFPGLGEQYVGMGLELYQTEPRFREHLDTCAALFERHLGEDLRRHLYPEGADAGGARGRGLDLRRMVLGGEPEEDAASASLNRTLLAQPAIFAIEYATARLLQDWGIRPREMIGYSIGEYTAACISGVLSLEDAVALVGQRARMIQELPPGAMLAVPLPREEVSALLDGDLSLSGSNEPSLCVVAGPVEAMQRLERTLTGKKVPYRRLRTTHAFHSKMMSPIVEPLLELIRGFRLAPPTIPYLSNVTGTWITAQQATDPAYWAAHLCQEVRFAEGIAELSTRGGRILLEVGPGQTLGSFALQQSGEGAAAKPIVLPTLRSSYDKQSDVAFLLKTLGRLWQAGAPIDGEALFAGERRRRVPLPAYPFERRRYWAPRRQAERGGAAPAASPATKRPLDQWFYAPSWKRSDLPAATERRAPSPGGAVLVFADGRLAPRLTARLRADGMDVIAVAAGRQFSRDPEGHYTLDPRQPEDYRSLFGDLTARRALPATVLHLWMVAPETVYPGRDRIDAAMELGFYSLLFAAQALGEFGAPAQVHVHVVSTHLQAVSGDEAIFPERAVLLGPCKVLPQEYRQITCSSVDVELPPEGSPKELALVERLLAELRAEGRDTVVAYRGAHRWVQTLDPIELRAEAGQRARLRERGVYLITGGLGGVGLALAEHLARAVQAKLVLVGRSPLPEREQWDAWLASHNAADPVSQKIRELRQLEALGAEVLALSADVADPEQAVGAVERAVARFGGVHGIIHAAGVFGGSLIQLKTREEAARILAPKVRGALLLEQLFRDRPLDLFVACSSLTGVVGGPGQVDYVAANAFLDAFAHSRAQQGGLTLSINWDDWKDVGAAFTLGGPDDFLAWRKEHYKTAMRTEEGVEVFGRALGSGLSQVIVSTRLLHPRMEELNRMTADASLESFGRTYRTGRSRPLLGNAYVAPRNDIERRIAGIWQDLLGVEPVGVHDAFADLGGHSLVATQLISRLRDAYRVDLSLRRIFDAPTVAELSQHIEELLVARLQQLSPGEVAERLSSSAERAPKAAPGPRPYRLPNGLEIQHQSKAEVDHFYDDIFVKHVYYKNGIRLGEGAVVFDVGANIGLFTLFVNQVCPTAQVYAFEPAPPLFAILRANVEQHGVRATLFNEGVSDREKTAEFTFYPNSSGMSSFYADLREEEEVFKAILQNQLRRKVEGMDEVMRHMDDLVQERFKSEIFSCRMRSLSDVIRERGIERIDLLKIDVQKSELDVLAGIKEADWRKIRQAALEVHDIDGGLEKATSTLQARGFTVIAEQDDLYEGSPIYNLYATKAL